MSTLLDHEMKNIYYILIFGILVLCVAFIMTRSFTWLQKGKDAPAERSSTQGEKPLAQLPMETREYPQVPPEVSQDPKVQAEFERTWWDITVSHHEKQLDQAMTRRAYLIRSMVVIGRHNARVGDLVMRLEQEDHDPKRVILEMMELLKDERDQKSSFIMSLCSEYTEISNNINIYDADLEIAKASRADALRRSEGARPTRDSGFSPVSE